MLHCTEVKGSHREKLTDALPASARLYQAT